MPNTIGLKKPWGAGESGNPKGRPKGTPSRKTILEYYLFEADMAEMDIKVSKAAWGNKVKPTKLYEVMTLAMAIKAMNGDHKAFDALNKALGDTDAAKLPPNPIQIINEIPRYKEEEKSEET